MAAMLSLISAIVLTKAITGCSSLSFKIHLNFFADSEIVLLEAGNVSRNALSIGIQSNAVLIFCWEPMLLS
jgi:hypothetical protein